MSETTDSIKEAKDSRGNVSYTISKSFATVPPILREYWEGKGKKAVRMYMCEGNRPFIADTWDKFFKVPGGKIRDKKFKDILTSPSGLRNTK